jgi:hypothetical protein
MGFCTEDGLVRDVGLGPPDGCANIFSKKKGDVWWPRGLYDA